LTESSTVPRQTSFLVFASIASMIRVPTRSLFTIVVAVP